MKRTIYSLDPLRQLLLAANRRYLEFISTIEEDKAGTDKLNKISQPVEENDRNYRGFNFFDPQDEKLFESLVSGEFNISGFQNKDLRRRLSDRNSGQISRTMKRLRVHGLIKKVGHLQVLPHRTRQTDHRPRPETQTTLHHPHALSTTDWLKVLPSSVRICRYRYYRNRLAKRRCERENHEQRVFHGLLLDETRRRGAGPVPGLG